MNIGQWLAYAQVQLRKAGVESGRLDTLLMLEYVCELDRAQLLAHQDKHLTETQSLKLRTLLERRKKHEPIAYITGSSEFYGHTFMITHDVLTPRPETEAMIELLLTINPAPTTIIDVGTGSGAVAISASLEIPTATILATDIDPQCLEVARYNTQNMHAHVQYVLTDLVQDIEPAQITSSTMLANLPYVPEDHPINSAAKHEPMSAIFSPEEGLQHYRRLFEQCKNKHAYPAFAICESLESQHDALKQLAQSNGFTLVQTEGLQQLFAA